MTEFLDAGSLEDIPRRGSRVVKIQMGCIAVFRTETDEVFALEDRCPHKGGPLSEGIVHGRAVTCPLHNRVIGFEDGEAKGNDEGRVQTFAVKVEDGRLLIDAALISKRSAA